MSILDDVSQDNHHSEDDIQDIRDGSDTRDNGDSPFYAGLDIPDEYLTDNFKRQGSIANVAKAFNHQLKTISSKGLQAPSEDASDEEVKAFYKTIGAPESAEGYKYDIAEDSFLDEETVNEHKDFFLKLGATPRQFRDGMNLLNENIKARSEKALQEEKERTDAARAQLQKAWGSKYEENIRAIDNTLNKLGADKELKQAMRESGISSDPRFIGMLHNITQTLGENVVSRSERSQQAAGNVEALRQARDAAEDSPMEYAALHQKYMDALANQKGVI